ncbi:PAS domain S-box protein [Aquabacterium sp.]|uniref:PAS domain S-box protein n=1 Tax=Aquabacterium sp. TaxID=1872578 RepID=UPI003D6CA4AD
MVPASTPVDEKLRLTILKGLRLLDSEPEDIFDRIVRLAANILDVPIAAVSLIDENRQWFKARVGLEASETPRDWAFCAHAIHHDDTMVVPDALEDHRFVDNPLVVGDPGIRFYAGVPITASSGTPLGTLCVIDRQPRQPTEMQLHALEDLASLLRSEIAQRERRLTVRRVSREVIGALQDSDAFFRVTFEQAAVGMAMVDLSGTWLRVNQKLADILGYTPDELKNLTFQDITHPADLDQDLGLVNQLVRGEASQYQLEKRYRRKDGGIVWVNLTVSLVRDGEGVPQYFVSVIEDIDARKQAQNSLLALRRDLEQRVVQRTASLQTANDMLTDAIQQRTESEAALRAREAELRAVLEHANDAYICIDQAGVIMEWNRQAEVTFGWSREEAIGLRIDETIIPAGQREGHRQGLGRLGRTGVGKILNERLELTAATRGGQTLSVEMSLYRLPSDSGQPRYCAFLHDISERKTLQQSLENQLRLDALTGLPNRRELLERLPQAIGRTRRSGKASAVLFLDLDGFKAVNDQLGHQAGDELLKQFAQRLKGCLRETDTPARLAGDEFVVLVELLDEPQRQVNCLARKIESVMAQPFELLGRSAQVGASIGIAVCQPDGRESADELLASADQAMYAAKRDRKRQA